MESREFEISARSWPLALVLVAVLVFSAPFVEAGMRGSDNGGMLGGAGGIIALILLVRIFAQLRLRWLASRLRMRVRAGLFGERQLSLSLKVHPTKDDTLSTLSVALHRFAPESVTGMVWVAEVGQYSLPLKKGQRASLDATFTLPEGDNFIAYIYVQRPARRPQVLSLFVSPSRPAAQPTLRGHDPLHEVAPQESAEGAPSDDPYRDRDRSVQQVKLTPFDQKVPPSRAIGTQQLWLSLGLFFHWSAVFAFGLFILARELNEFGALIGLGGVGLGLIGVGLSRLHSVGVNFSAGFSLFFLLESQLLWGVRGPYYMDAVSQLLLLGAGVSFLALVLHWYGLERQRAT